MGMCWFKPWAVDGNSPRLGGNLCYFAKLNPNIESTHSQQEDGRREWMEADCLYKTNEDAPSIQCNHVAK